MSKAQSGIGRVLGPEALGGLPEPLALGLAEDRNAGEKPFLAELLDLRARERHAAAPGIYAARAGPRPCSRRPYPWSGRP